MRNTKLYLALLAAAALLFAVPAVAQEPLDAVVGSITADDTSPALVIKYIGPNVSGLAAVGTNAITLTSGAAGSEAADTTIECPLSAPYAGVIDLTNAACDTLGEIADVVNGTAGSKWRVFIVAGFRSDLAYSTTQKLNNLSAASANGGVSVFWDTSVAFHTSIALGRVTTAYADYFTPDGKILVNPYKGQWIKFLSADAVNTYASGTSFFEVYVVEVRNNPLTGKGTEVVTKVFSKAAGATTAWANFLPTNGFGLFGKKDAKLILRLNNSAAQSVVTILAYGLVYPTQAY